MPWPTPQDYNEAVQNPRLAFADGELQTGHAELTPLGIPRPISGGFANVYKMRCSSRVWAVRCFIREYKDHQQRYQAINEQLDRARLPYTAGFRFPAKGIRVHGDWYPILKMEWVQGEGLTKFVSANLHRPEALRSLATDIVEMSRSLQGAGIAHGDLQHGNIIIVGHQIRLIDYDGMYVPSLQGRGSHEVGHPNYQHPARSEGDFGAALDNFSVWVLYLSLLALSAQPRLWGPASGRRRVPSFSPKKISTILGYLACSGRWSKCPIQPFRPACRCLGHCFGWPLFKSQS
jgi:hypothetical protein